MSPDGSPTGFDLDLHIIDKDSWLPVGFACGRRDGSDESVTLPVYAGQTYHVMVHDYEWSSVDAPYLLSTTLVSNPAADAADNNDTGARATIVVAVAAASSSSFQATLSHQRDVDWYLYESPSADLFYRLTLTPPLGLSYALFTYIYDATASTPWVVHRGGFSPVDGPYVASTASNNIGYLDRAFYFNVFGAPKGPPALGSNEFEPRYFDPVNTYEVNIETSPASPATVMATLNGSSVEISWDVSAGATAYNLFWSDTGVAARDSTAVLGITGTTHTHSNPGAGTYSYLITAVRDGMQSAGTLSTSTVTVP